MHSISVFNTCADNSTGMNVSNTVQIESSRVSARSTTSSTQRCKADIVDIFYSVVLQTSIALIGPSGKALNSHSAHQRLLAGFGPSPRYSGVAVSWTADCITPRSQWSTRWVILRIADLAWQFYDMQSAHRPENFRNFRSVYFLSTSDLDGNLHQCKLL
jgi:hypothetical protein